LIEILKPVVAVTETRKGTNKLGDLGFVGNQPLTKTQEDRDNEGKG